MGWNICTELGSKELEFLVGAAFNWAGMYRWRWSQMGWNICNELSWLLRMELESNGQEYFTVNYFLLDRVETVLEEIIERFKQEDIFTFRRKKPQVLLLSNKKENKRNLTKRRFFLLRKLTKMHYE
jgi:hypothetical protein